MLGAVRDASPRRQRETRVQCKRGEDGTITFSPGKKTHVMQP